MYKIKESIATMMYILRCYLEKWWRTD